MCWWHCIDISFCKFKLVKEASLTQNDPPTNQTRNIIFPCDTPKRFNQSVCFPYPAGLRLLWLVNHPIKVQDVSVSQSVNLCAIIPDQKFNLSYIPVTAWLPISPNQTFHYFTNEGNIYERVKLERMSMCFHVYCSSKCLVGSLCASLPVFLFT